MQRRKRLKARRGRGGSGRLPQIGAQHVTRDAGQCLNRRHTLRRDRADASNPLTDGAGRSTARSGNRLLRHARLFDEGFQTVHADDLAWRKARRNKNLSPAYIPRPRQQSDNEECRIGRALRPKSATMWRCSATLRRGCVTSTYRKRKWPIGSISPKAACRNGYPAGRR